MTTGLNIDTSLFEADRAEEALLRSFLPGYDANGEFNPRYLPGHRWEKADTVAGRIRDALRLTLNRTSSGDVCHATGIQPKTRDRVISQLLGVTQPPERDGNLDERWPGALAHAHAVADRLDAADDAVLACLREGLMLIGRGIDSACPRVPSDHPAAVAWRAEQQDEGMRRLLTTWAELGDDMLEPLSAESVDAA